MRNDPEQAVADYKEALALGGTRSVPELYQKAGAEFDFSERVLSPLVAELAAQIAY